MQSCIRHILLILAVSLTGQMAYAQKRPVLPETAFDYLSRFLISLDRTGVANSAANGLVSNEGATLGRVLFYDAKLSINDSIACASCHQQAKAFTDGRQFSIGFEGGLTSRNSMAAFNTTFHLNGFFWDLRAPTLEEQVLMPIEDPLEMGMSLDALVEKLADIDYYPPLFEAAFGTDSVTAEGIATALAEFLRTIISDRSKYDEGIPLGFSNFTEQEEHGRQLFSHFAQPGSGERGTNCFLCHSATTLLFEDKAASEALPEFFASNGLDQFPEDNGYGGVTGDSAHMGTFKIPTLRNIEFTAPYMHDGRFESLQEVVEHYDTGLQPHLNLSPILAKGGNEVPMRLDLTQEEKEALLTFLTTFTDTALIADTLWSDPFQPATAIDPPPETLPMTVELFQNYPNPFNPETDFGFRISDFGYVEIGVYSISGQLIRTILRRRMQAGSHLARWDGKNDQGETVASGIYIYTLEMQGREQVAEKDDFDEMMGAAYRQSAPDDRQFTIFHRSAIVLFLLIIFLLPPVRLFSQEIKLVAADTEINDNFGFDVSISADYAAISAPGDDDFGDLSGAVYIFHLANPDSNQWVQVQRLTASDADAAAFFGGSLSLSADYLLIGARGDDAAGFGSGAAYLFERNGGDWEEIAKLTASDASGSDLFGFSVALDGHRAVIGALREANELISNGAIYIFERDSLSGEWLETAKLRASDGNFEDEFAQVVDISGDRVIVGAPFDDDDGFRSGSAYLYHKAENGWGEEIKLVADPAQMNAWFGYAVALSGDLAWVGAPQTSGDYLLEGAAMLLSPGNDAWEETLRLSPAQMRDDQLFGDALDLHPGMLVAGAAGDDELGESAGAMSWYTDRGNGWELAWKVVADDGHAFQGFGRALSLHNDYLLIGARNDHQQAQNGGAAYIYPTHDWPYISSRPDTLAIADSIYQYQLTVFEPEDEAVIYELLDTPSFLQMTGDVLSGMPAESDIGNHLVKLRASDPHGFFSEQEFMLRVDKPSGLTQTGGRRPGTAGLSVFPNPFNASTTLSYQLRQPEAVRLAVFDLTGRHVRLLFSGRVSEGSRQLVWDGRDDHGRSLPSGIYFIQLKTPEEQVTMRAVLLK